MQFASRNAFTLPGSSPRANPVMARTTMATAGFVMAFAVLETPSVEGTKERRPSIPIDFELRRPSLYSLADVIASVRAFVTGHEISRRAVRSGWRRPGEP